MNIWALKELQDLDIKCCVCNRNLSFSIDPSNNVYKYVQCNYLNFKNNDKTLTYIDSHVIFIQYDGKLYYSIRLDNYQLIMINKTTSIINIENIKPIDKFSYLKNINLPLWTSANVINTFLPLKLNKDYFNNAKKILEKIKLLSILD